MAPILSFTAEEIWDYLPTRTRRPASTWRACRRCRRDSPMRRCLPNTTSFLKVRGEIKWGSGGGPGRIKQNCHRPRRPRCLAATPRRKPLSDVIRTRPTELQTLAQVAELQSLIRLENHLPAGLRRHPVSAEVPGLVVVAAKAPGEKCVRCWFHYPGVGEDPRHPQVCRRCRQVLAGNPG